MFVVLVLYFLKYVFTFPSNLEGNRESKFIQINEEYFIDSVDSSLWKKDLKNDILMQIIPDKVVQIQQGSLSIGGETKNIKFNINLKTDSITYTHLEPKFTFKKL